MKIICIEGIDAVGKETVSKELEKYLKNSGYRVERISFPRYDKPIGAAIREVLNSKSLNAPSLDNDLFSPMYTLDRLQYFKENIERLNNDCDYLILDRGFYSNLMYQASKIYMNFNCYNELYKKIGYWIDKNYKWEILNTGIFRYEMYTFILSMSIEDSEKQIQIRTSMDSHESNRKYLSDCKEFINFLNKGNTKIFIKSYMNSTAYKYYFKNVYNIPVVHGDTPEAIHKSIDSTLSIILKYMNIYKEVNIDGKN